MHCCAFIFLSIKKQIHTEVRLLCFSSAAKEIFLTSFAVNYSFKNLREKTKDLLRLYNPIIKNDV